MLLTDAQTDRLFWVDAKQFTIFSCDLQGRDRRLILKSHNYLNHPFSVAVFNVRHATCCRVNIVVYTNHS